MQPLIILKINLFRCSSMSRFDPDPSNIWSCGIVNRLFLYFIINSLSCYLLSLSTNYLVSLRILELVSLFNHLSSQYSKSWLCVAAVEIFQKVLISSDLTRKFHQRFKRRIISTCTFHAAADPIGKLLAFFNLWGIQIGFFCSNTFEGLCVGCTMQFI